MYEKFIDREELIKNIGEIVAIPSVVSDAKPGMPYGEKSAEALAYALSLAKSMGFRTYNAGNVYGYAEYGEGEEMIAVLGHVDVVPEGSGWVHEAFNARIEDGRLYGRGTCDDKGPIIGALHALKAVIDSGTKLKRRVRIIFGGGEEVGARDMVMYAENEEHPVMGFTPDGYYPVIHGEKGMLQLRLTKTLDGKVYAKAGIAVNQVPDHAEITYIDVDGNEAVVIGKGKNAHGSRPFDGANAIDDMFRNLDLSKAPDDIRELASFYERYFMDDCYGEKIGLASGTAEFGKNTLNLGTLSSEVTNVTSKVTFGIDYRTNPELPLDDVIACFRELAEKNGYYMEIAARLDTLYIPKEDPLVSILTEIYQENTGRNDEPLCIGGGTYAKRLPNMVAFGNIYPGDEDRMHQADEYVAIDRLLLSTEMMAQAIERLANM